MFSRNRKEISTKATLWCFNQSVVFYFLAFLLLGGLNFGCEQKTEPETPLSEPTAQQLPSDHPPLSQEGISNVMPKQESLATVVPEGVKGNWEAVRLVVDDKHENKSKEYIVGLNDKLIIPNSNIVVEVGEFLPDFKIDESSFTSASNELGNPAVYVNILENGKSIFDGWLFSMFPTIHPFHHDQFKVILKGGVATDTRP